MKRLNLHALIVLVVLVALLTACSAPDENSGSPNASAPQQSNSNSAPQSQIAQSTAPAETPVTLPPVTLPPAVQPVTALPEHAEKPASGITANPAKAPDVSAAANARVPKLVIAEKKIDYGKQPQDKTLIRAINVKNAGRADLNIESVVPS